MNGFDHNLDAYLHGKLQLPALSNALDQLLDEAPEAAREIYTRLQALLDDSRIDARAYEELTKRIEAARPGADKVEMTADDDATVLQTPPMPDNDVTVVTDDDRTVLATPAPSASPHAKLGPGTLLKGRFRLESRLGQGGMGVVYKATDLLRVEAQDRQPHVAVKVLSDSFRDHPGAFVALQREASKSQRLAHPNIATVYDFDRDGATVYMTMELLEGEPLNTFIRALPEGGLPLKEALRMVAELGHGLAYAHKHGLVHSDFKPGNAYLTREGVVKVLDFGIARAGASSTEAQGEETLFDPSGLSALTPAYAAMEMFEGREPDPRDDIYALACVACELLTGKHPFGKKSAPAAQAQGMTPPQIKGLSRRQQRALNHALSFEREHRTATIEQFLDGILNRHARRGYWVAGGIAAALLALVAVKPLQQAYYHHETDSALVADLSSNNPDRVEAAVASLRPLAPPRRSAILNRASDKLVAYFRGRAEHYFSPADGRYDYPDAHNVVNEAKSLLPDAPGVATLAARIANVQKAQLQQLNARFNNALQTDRLLPDDGPDSLTDILGQLHHIAPNSDLFADPRLCAYLHLSVQSGSETVLARMDRGHGVEEVHRIAEQARRARPDVAIATDLIVGFPGETAEEFAETESFVQAIGFAKLHVFPYSPRAGTPAAEQSDSVTPQEKKRRAAALRAAGRELRERFRVAQYGRRVQILVERGGTGLSGNYLRLKAPTDAKAGDLVRVDVTPERLAEG